MSESRKKIRKEIMNCWICEKDVLDEPKAEYVMVHWRCLDRLRMDIDHLSNLEREKDE